MKYCGNCGAKIPDGIKFCPKCGTPVDKFEKQLKNNGQVIGSNVKQNSQTQGQQSNFNTQFPNQPNNFSNNNSEKTTNRFMNSLRKYRTALIVAVLVIIVGGFAFTKTATYNGMTTDDREKTIDLYNASGMFKHISKSDAIVAKRVVDGKDNGDCSIAINKKNITFRTNYGYDMDDYLMDRDNYGNHDDDKQFINGIQKASQYALDNWGRGYEITLKDSDGDTYLTYKNGTQTLNRLADYDDN